ncbi:hypothetical protein [Natronolimnohabitans innermongolicus]|uniref:hypothetical protein n=1 Tax=Natronolimnohabitans innermongolicus TaxID=253107 RepID=UPI00126904FD|nr:hypothetical protein [Natronolimnohabitans innermongolicus]
MNYNTTEQNRIRLLFDDLNSSEIEYVVPRGHQQLPERTPGGDIDFIIHPDSFDSAVNIAKERGFLPKKSSQWWGIAQLGIKGLSRPRATVQYVINTPKKAKEHVIARVSGSNRSIGRGTVTDWRAYSDDIMVHLRNHLAYKSPWNSGEYRVDPLVEEQLFKHRQLVDGISIPSLPDELAHLICRGVFDKEGEFPEYYASRCNTLFEQMSEAEKSRFKEILSLIFFDADQFVFEHIVNSEYNMILSDLKSYSNY